MIAGEPSPIMEAAALGRQTNSSALGVSLGAVAAACLTAFTLIAQTVALPEPGFRGLMPVGPPSALRQALTLFAPAAGPAVVPVSPATPSVVEPAVPVSVPAAPASADPSAPPPPGPAFSATRSPTATTPERTAGTADPPGRAVGFRRGDKSPGRQHAKRKDSKAGARKGRGAARASAPQSRAPGRSHSQVSSRGSGGGRSKSYGQKTSRGKANGKAKGSRGFSRGRGRGHGRNGRN